MAVIHQALQIRSLGNFFMLREALAQRSDVDWSVKAEAGEAVGHRCWAVNQWYSAGKKMGVAPWIMGGSSMDHGGSSKKVNQNPGINQNPTSFFSEVGGSSMDTAFWTDWSCFQALPLPTALSQCGCSVQLWHCSVVSVVPLKRSKGRGDPKTQIILAAL